MTIALAIWLIFKSILLTLAAIFFAIVAFCASIGGILSADDTAPRWLCPALLAVALVNILAAVLTMGGVAQIVLSA